MHDDAIGDDREQSVPLEFSSSDYSLEYWPGSTHEFHLSMDIHGHSFKEVASLALKALDELAERVEDEMPDEVGIIFEQLKQLTQQYEN